MPEELHAQIVAPRTRRRAIVIGCCLLAAAIAVTLCVFLLPGHERSVSNRARVVPLDALDVVDEVVPPLPAPGPRSFATDEPVPPPPRDVFLMVSVGGDSYIEVELDAIDEPKHRAPRMLDGEPVVTAIADVAAKDLPEYARAWQRRKVIVDGTCEARVTGFALIARLEGNASDAGDGLTRWTAKTVMEYGNASLYARLDGCAGTFARDAARPAIALLDETSAADDVTERALERFVASDAVVTAQDAWREVGNDGNWYEAPDALLTTSVLKHPRTGVVWIVIHAYEYNGCGHAGGNAVGMFRVAADGSLVTAVLRGASMASIERVIDLDNDGEPELVTSSESLPGIERANGDLVCELGVVSYGCGC